MVSLLLAAALVGTGYGYGGGYAYGHAACGVPTYHTAVVAPQVVTPYLAVPVSTLGLPYYYSAGDNIRADSIADAVFQRIAQRAQAEPAQVEPVQQPQYQQQPQYPQQQYQPMQYQQAPDKSPPPPDKSPLEPVATPQYQQPVATPQYQQPVATPQQPQQPAATKLQPLTFEDSWGGAPPPEAPAKAWSAPPPPNAPPPVEYPSQQPQYQQPQYQQPQYQQPQYQQPHRQPLQYRQLSYTTPGGANLDNQVGSIFAQRCASCHGAGKAKGVQLFTRAGGLFTVADRGAEADRRSRIAAAVAHEPGVQPMPKNGAPLSGGDVDVIRRWALAFTSGGR